MNDSMIRLDLGRAIVLISFFAAASTAAIAQNLDDYVQQALDNHPRLNAVEADRKSALERAEQADVLPDPVLTAGVFLFPVETRVGPQRGNISAMQKFPWFGSLEAEKEVYLAGARTEEVNLAQERLVLERSLRRVYYDLYGRQKKEYWQGQLIESLRFIEHLTEMSYSQGKGSMADVVRVEIELEEAAFQLEDLEDRESVVRAQFNALMHRSPEATVRLPDTLEMHPPALPANARWESHPAYRRFQAQQEEWKAKQALTEKEGKPTIGLGLNYIVTAERDLSELEDNGKDAVLPMAQIRLPIWSKKYDHKREAFRWKEEAALSRQEAWKDEWNSRVEDARYAMNRAEKRYDLLADQIQSTRKAQRLLRSAYRNADADIDELLRMEMQLIQYRKEQVDQLVRFYQARAEWNYLINKN